MKSILFAILFGLHSGSLSAQEALSPADHPPAQAASPATEAPPAPPSQPSAGQQTEPVDPTDEMAANWRKEAGRAEAEVIQGENHGSLSRINKSVVIRDQLHGSVSVIRGTLYVLGEVSGSVSVVAGDAVVLGKVGGPVSVIGGNLRVSGTIQGDASVVGGGMVRTDTATITGGSSVVGGRSKHRSYQGTFSLQNGFSWSAVLLSPWWLLWKGLLMIWWVLAAQLVAVIAPDKLEEVRRRLESEPARIFAIGVVFWIVFWLLVLGAIILSAVAIGIPILGLLALVYIGVKWFGLTVLFLWVGRGLCTRLNWSHATVIVPVIVGGLCLGLLRLIPVLGTLLWFVMGFFAAGAVILAFAQRNPAPPLPPPHPNQQPGSL